MKRKRLKKSLFASVLAWLCSAAVAGATVTVRNYFDNDGAKQHVVLLDINGDAVDAHDGQIIDHPTDATIKILYGTSYGCGRKWQDSGSAFCGFKSYYTRDFKAWYPMGYLFDASGGTWQGYCVPNGCYRPHVVYVSGESRPYKLWVNVTAGGGSYRVLDSTSPYSGFTAVAQGTFAAGADRGDFDILKHSNGNCYFYYTEFPGGSGHKIMGVQLNASCTDSTGSAITVQAATGTHPSGSTWENPAAFEKGGSTHVIISHTCPYCANTESQVMTASTPLGSFSAGTNLNATSCGTQPRGVSKIALNSGFAYLFHGDNWKTDNAADTSRNVGWPQQGRANHFFMPLTFSTDTPQTYSCDYTFTLDLTADGANNAPAGLDQSSVADNFSQYCDIRGTYQRYQTFTPAFSGVLSEVPVYTMQGQIEGGTCAVGGSCTAPDQDLSVSIVSHGSGQPGSVLYSTTLSRTAVSFSLSRHSIFPGIAVTGGAKYGLVLTPAASISNGGCYGFAFNDGGGNLAGGEAYIYDGKTWTQEVSGTRDLLFRDIVGGPVVTRWGSGVRWGASSVRWGQQ